MKNPYFELHKEFRAAGAEVLMSSGQACVLYGIAAFSKDGDWIVKEDGISCSKILEVLADKGAQYRLGMPLDERWLTREWASRFEYVDNSGYRVRADFCSLPPRIEKSEYLWKNAVHRQEIDVVDVESLIKLKETRRVRDYMVIGSLAESIGFKEDVSEIALNYLQDYEILKKSVEKWPEESKNCTRRAVQLLLAGAPRKEVVSELAMEQDDKIQKDQHRIDTMIGQSKSLLKIFSRLKSEWKENNTGLIAQHDVFIRTLLKLAVL